MTNEQKQDFMSFLQKFCVDNHGNRLNEWLAESFLNRAFQKLEAIQKTGQPAVPNDARIDLDKLPFPS